MRGRLPEAPERAINFHRSGTSLVPANLMDTLRLIVDPPASGAWNMAVDEALLETAAISGLATLRFYTWQEPTLSLGYFQSAVDRDHHPDGRDCPLVRRASGGGAIIHDRELTYSIALPRRLARPETA